MKLGENFYDIYDLDISSNGWELGTIKVKCINLQTAGHCSLERFQLPFIQSTINTTSIELALYYYIQYTFKETLN